MKALLALALLAASLVACGDDDGDSGDGGGPPDLYSCELNSQCRVVPESCCGTCGAPTRDDAVAINGAAAAAHSARACEDGVGCPACAPLFIDPTLVATCRAGRCELVDLLDHQASACAQDVECKVRTPDCCECGGDTGLGRLIGVSTTAERDYAELVCDEQACPECAPIYPAEVTVECNRDGHCETNDGRLP